MRMIELLKCPECGANLKSERALQYDGKVYRTRRCVHCKKVYYTEEKILVNSGYVHMLFNDKATAWRRQKHE